MEEQKEESNFEYILNLEKLETGDENRLIIAGTCSSGDIDHDGERVDMDSLRSQFLKYMENPVIRFFHGKDSRNPDAIGKAIPEYIDPDGKVWKTEFRETGPFIVAEISNADDVASIRTKIVEKNLRGLSIGGRAKRVKAWDATLGKDVNNVIVSRWNETSVVDLPASKTSYFEVLKAACTGDDCPLNNGTESIEKEEGKAPKAWWDNCMGTAKGIPGMADAPAFCNWMWTKGEEAGFATQRTAIGKSEVDDPIVDQAVAKFEAIITENTEMQDTLTKLESEIQDLKGANDPDTIMKGEENENNNHISTIEKNVEVADQLGGMTMENEDGIVRMEVPELETFIEDTVTKMVKNQETVEKLEDYDRLVAEIKDLRTKIGALEAKAEANVKALPEGKAMKSETDADDTETVEKGAKKDKEPEKKYDEDGNEIVDAAEMKMKKMEAEITELKSSPLYKAQQEDTPVEKGETPVPSGILAGVITAHYGGT